MRIHVLVEDRRKEIQSLQTLEKPKYSKISRRKG
jgi:hypothetical protein